MHVSDIIIHPCHYEIVYSQARPTYPTKINLFLRQLVFYGVSFLTVNRKGLFWGSSIRQERCRLLLGKQVIAV